MEGGGPFGSGEFPEDFEAEGPAHEPPTRGWIAPEDRLWRHPSELGAATGAAGDPRGRPRLRWPALAAGALSVAAVAAVATVVAGGGSAPTNATDTSVSVGPDVIKVVDAMQASLVSVVPSEPSRGAAQVTGVVLPDGNLVATAAAAVKDDEKVTVVSGSGQRVSGVVTGVDDETGVAVVRMTQKMTAGPFADEPVAPEELAVAACRCNSGAALSSAPRVALGMVRTEGTGGAGDGGPSLIDTIEAEMPLGSSALGSVLLDDVGGVLGVLDAERSVGNDTMGYFVPSSLVVAVAEELARHHTVSRGWLGVMAQDDHGAGAAVISVVSGSPAATAGIQPGDVVEAVDSHLVSSLADLVARLYVWPPGTLVDLTVLHAGSVEAVHITLAATP